MGVLNRIVQIIEKITDIIGGYLQGWIVFFLMVMVLVEVLTRYILQSPLSIADEMGGYLLVSITFMGLAYTWKEKSHVRVELLLNSLPEKGRQWLRLITLTMATVFCIPLIMGSYELLQDSMFFEAKSGSWLRTPLVYPQTVLIIGSVLLLVQLLAELVKVTIKLKKTERKK